MVIDTSAIVAILLDEPTRRRIEERLQSNTCVMSAATRVELGIVIESRRGAEGALLLEELLDRFGVIIVPVDARLAATALTGWRMYGKGRHPAGLKYGDCFSYALAVERGETLLFVGDELGRTDVSAALERS